MVNALPRNRIAAVIGDQVLRSGTSVGANYRAACRARSQAEFVSRMPIVLEEADETQYWMELLIESNLMKPQRLESLRRESEELVAIAVASINTVKRKQRNQRA
jgi:four helix bundle protein